MNKEINNEIKKKLYENFKKIDSNKKYLNSDKNELSDLLKKLILNEEFRLILEKTVDEVLNEYDLKVIKLKDNFDYYQSNEKIRNDLIEKSIKDRYIYSQSYTNSDTDFKKKLEILNNIKDKNKNFVKKEDDTLTKEDLIFIFIICIFLVYFRSLF